MSSKKGQAAAEKRQGFCGQEISIYHPAEIYIIFCAVDEPAPPPVKPFKLRCLTPIMSLVFLSPSGSLKEQRERQYKDV